MRMNELNRIYNKFRTTICGQEQENIILREYFKKEDFKIFSKEGFEYFKKDNDSNSLGLMVSFEYFFKNEELIFSEWSKILILLKTHKKY